MRVIRSAAIGLVFAVVMAGGPAAVHADWRDDTQVLRIGYLSSDNPTADARRMEPFRAYMAAAVALPVELVPAANYGALIDAAVDGRTQYAIHSATSFAAANVACDCLVPLGVPSAFDGSTGFYAILLAEAGSKIRSLADARGARLALSGEDSIAGRLVPMKAFAAEGIDPPTYFASITDYPGPEAAIGALLAGEADLAVGWSSLSGDPASGYAFGVLTRLVLDRRIVMDQVQVVWQSRRIPFGPHALRRDMAPELRTLLSDALLSMVIAAPEALEAVDRSGYGGGGFVAVDPADFGVVADLVTPPAN